jgi:mevalonate kinase
MTAAARSVSFFSPGEVIFFGEHSVVYGRGALGAAITRGITAAAELTDDGFLKIYSRLGEYEARVRRTSGAFAGIEDERGNAKMLPLGKTFGRIFNEFGAAPSLRVTIDSDIPEESGLASSAAVSSALAAVALWAAGRPLPSSEEMVRRVFEGEIDLQKRGSVMGSACTVNGGFIAVHDGRWQKAASGMPIPAVAVIDSLERCATSVTTGRVKDRLERDRTGTEAIFDRMDEFARRGQACMQRGDWEGAGHEMVSNQACLKELQVSTSKIDRLIEAVRPHVYGAKITGAGGGGCIVCLPRPGAESALAKTAAAAGGELLACRISAAGVRQAEAGVGTVQDPQGGAACKR